jgi:Carboxypeptidase regulatory-like domain
MRLQQLSVIAVALVLACLGLASTARAQGVGAIGGSATDQSGAVLPGVTVTLLNSGTIGGSQTTVTDPNGSFQFLRLVPGRYSIKGELVGFQSVVHQDIVVNADSTARVDLRLRVGDLAETVTVSGEAPLLDTTAVLNQTVMSREVLDTLPGTNDVWGIAKLVPAVTLNQYDVGGTNGFQQSTVSVHGSRNASETAYLIDGMNIGSVGSDGGTVTMYYDPFMFEQINYQAGGVSAETSRGGIVYNMITQTGTNVLRGAMMFNGSNEHLQSNNITPELRSDLLKAVPPLALQANPDLEPGSKIISMYDTGISLSGPVVRDKVWFVATGKLVRLDQLRVGSYNPDGSQFVDDNEMVTISGKGSWAMSSNSQLHYSYTYNNKQRFHWSGNSTTDFWESAATRRQKLETNLNQVKWTRTFSSKVVADASASQTRTFQPILEQENVGPGSIAAFDSLRRANLTAAPVYEITRYQRSVAHASVSAFFGKHDVKIGYQFDHGRHGNESWSTSHYPSGIRAVFRNGIPDSVNTYNTPSQNVAYILDTAMFAQDRWRPTRKLTFNLGLRLEKLTGWQPEVCQAETIFIAGQCFDELKDVPRWFDPAPRFGAIYDLFADGRSAIKFGVSRYNIGTASGHSSRVNPNRVTNDTRPWVDNGDLIPQLNELGPSTGFNLGTTNRYDPDVERPYAIEYFTEFEQQLRANIVVSAGFYYRGTRRLIGQRNVAVPTPTYTRLEVTEAASGQKVTVYNQDPALRGRFDTVWDNYPGLDTTYKGVDLTINRRMSNRWMLMGSASFGKNEGDIYPEQDLNNPNFQFRKGVVGQDIPRSVKASGIYEFPWDVTVSGNFQHYAGAPELTTVSVARDTVVLTQVTQSITVEPRGTTRLPNVTLVDFNARRLFRINNRTIEPVIELHNVFNSNAIQDRTTVLGPAYGQVNNILRGRMVKFGMNVKF